MTPAMTTPRAAFPPLRRAGAAGCRDLGPRPARTSSVVRFAARACAVVGLAGCFQVLTPGSAAVSTLPEGWTIRQPAMEAVAEAPVPRHLDGALFAAILSEAFPGARLRTGPDGLDVPSTDPGEILQFGSRKAPRWLVETILKAAQVTGVDPVYLMTLADIESSLSPRAKAPTSSAEGLFQFIDRTWLETLHLHGAAHGFSAAAHAIRLVDDEPVLAHESQRPWIMSLRRDPYLAALMAGELIKDVARALQAKGERELTEAELYLAHFFGAQSAVRFLSALDETPDTAASKLFPRAAKANLGLFSERQGRKRRSVSVSELYDRIDSKIVRRLNAYDTVAASDALKPTADTTVSLR